MAKINGGIIGPNNPTGPFSAGGVWRLEDAFNAQKAGTWPVVLGYQVPNSLRFNSGSSDNLSKTFGTATNRRIYTISTWTKRSSLAEADTNLFTAGVNSTGDAGIRFQSQNKLSFYEISSPYSTYNYQLDTNQLFRDASAWYHILVAFDSTQATDTNRIKIYINGSQVTSLASAIYPSQNYDGFINNNITHRISGAVDTTFGTRYYNGYVSESYFIDGQALTPSSFGQTDSTTGIWTPIAYTGTYGNNGFYLKFANSASLGTDSSGNANTWTVNNLTSIDQSYDSPTNNFATLNPLVNYQAYPPVLAEGNLKNTSNANASNGGTSPSTIVVSQGKWYAEMKVGANKQDGTALGIVTDSYRFDYQNDAAFYTSASFSSVAYLGDGRKVISNTFSSYGATFTTNDIIGIAVDLDNDTVTFYKNGVSQGVISTTLTGGYFICCYGYNSSVQEMNFGYPPFTIASGNADANGFGNFEYAVPSGYYALCSKNLALYG